MEPVPFKTEKGQLVGFIEKDGYYVTGIACDNCGKRFGAIYIKKGVLKREFMKKELCPECGCPLSGSFGFNQK
jgi:ssDNA-binding Zn-finger/Zn-ribbon topoisomerase 1